MKQSPRHDDRRRFRERCRPQRRMFHVKQLRSSATRHPHPQQRGTRTRAITPNTHTRRSTADTKRGTAFRQHPAQSVTNAHTWAPLTHSPAPQLHKGTPRPTQTPHTNGRTEPSDPQNPQAHEALKPKAPARPQAHGAHKPTEPTSPQAHGAHKPLTHASRAVSAQGPHASARRPRRGRSRR